MGSLITWLFTKVLWRRKDLNARFHIPISFDRSLGVIGPEWKCGIRLYYLLFNILKTMWSYIIFEFLIFHFLESKLVIAWKYECVSTKYKNQTVLHQMRNTVYKLWVTKWILTHHLNDKKYPNASPALSICAFKFTRKSICLDLNWIKVLSSDCNQLVGVSTDGWDKAAPKWISPWNLPSVKSSPGKSLLGEFPLENCHRQISTWWTATYFFDFLTYLTLIDNTDYFKEKLQRKRRDKNISYVFVIML